MSDTQTPAPSTPQTPPASIPGGPLQSDAPDSGPLRNDDFGLGGDMRQQLVDALTERWNPDADPDQQPTPPDPTTPPADTAATPVPAPDPSPVASTQPTEDGAGGGGAADPQTPAAGDPGQPAPTAPVPTPDEADLNQLARDYFGTALTREQSQELFGILGGLQALSPQQRARMDELIAQGALDNPYPVTGQPPNPVQYPPAVNAPTDTADPAVALLGPRPDDDYTGPVWDMQARAVRAQQQQLDAIQANIAQQTALDQQRQRDQAAARINNARDEWKQTHPLLNDEEFGGLYQRVEQSGQFAAAVAAHHGDVEAAFNSLMDQHFWADARFRERAMANAASGRDPMDPGQTNPDSPVAQQQQQLEQGRQQLAGAVAAGGGSATPPPGTRAPVPNDPTQKREAMIQELATHDFT